ncbi:NEUM protein, partial [Atractosteus spatula]|nr:NEUM protein [Atractosteus spatula]
MSRFCSLSLNHSTSLVEKNEEADQKIEQDGNKPEDKAHKAATKIQASFRGHIIRKKLKDEKKEDGTAAPEAAAAADGVENKEEKASSPATESKEPAAEAVAEPSTATAEAKREEADAAETSKEEAKPAAATDPSEKAKDVAAPEEKAAAETEGENKEAPPAQESATTTSASTESAQSPNAVEPAEKKEPQQADVPAADASETTPKVQSEETDCNQPQDKQGSPCWVWMLASTTSGCRLLMAMLCVTHRVPRTSQSRLTPAVDAVEESKPAESDHTEETKVEDIKADQENV